MFAEFSDCVCLRAQLAYVVRRGKVGKADAFCERT